MVNERLIMELEKYKKLAKDFFSVMKEREREAEDIEERINELLREIGEEHDIRSLPYNVFADIPDEHDANRFFENLDETIKILKEEY